jgi:hypothetical protein
MSGTARRAIACVFVLSVLNACQTEPQPAPLTAPTAPDPAADAQSAFERRDWDTAARLLRQAIVRDPANVGLHFRLAICATWLDASDEAQREFEWVVAHAPPGSEEARTARGWLARPVGGDESTTTASDRESRPPSDEVSAGVEGSVAGRAVWAESGPPGPQRRLQLHLMGLAGTTSQGVSYTIRSDEQGRYEFPRVAPGPYKLTNALAATPIWRLKVQVERGKKTALELTPENSVRMRDDFP